MVKKRLNISRIPEEENSDFMYVFGWCVMASEQNAEKNKIIIYTDKKKPHRGNNGWEGDSAIYYGPTNDKKLIEGRTCHSDPILVKMRVEAVL